jgi:hypothetical protein
VVATWRPAPFELLEENRGAFELFLAADTQWRFAGHAPVGLDFAAVRAIADLLGVALTPALFGALRVIEAEAVHLLNARARRRTRA